MNSHSQDVAAAATAASMSGVAGTVYSNSVLERLLQNHRTTGGPVGAFQAGMAPSPLSHDSGRVMNQHDIFSVQNRNRMIAALQQQQRQLTAASIATRGLPTLHQNISQDFRGAHRFMVDDFAGAGNLLSRSEQDMLLSRYPSMAVTGHMGLGGHSDMDFVNTTKLADLLLAKQVALQEAGKPRTTRLPCQARGMKADHNSSVRPPIGSRSCLKSRSCTLLSLVSCSHDVRFLAKHCVRPRSLKCRRMLATGNTCCVPTPPAGLPELSFVTACTARSQSRSRTSAPAICIPKWNPTATTMRSRAGAAISRRRLPTGKGPPLLSQT